MLINHIEVSTLSFSAQANRTKSVWTRTITLFWCELVFLCLFVCLCSKWMCWEYDRECERRRRRRRQGGSVHGGASQRTSWSRPGARGWDGMTTSSLYSIHPLLPLSLIKLINDRCLQHRYFHKFSKINSVLTKFSPDTEKPHVAWSDSSDRTVNSRFYINRLKQTKLKQTKLKQTALDGKWRSPKSEISLENRNK